MFVKSLTLKGFKSFADAVTLDLRPGVNVVVGPNGSGKSNVIDAVAWVLGAQGARALRGGKMDDVIFAGTGNRAPLGRAEVQLTIDNSDGAIPIEFSEVSITRTLFRTGESEYAINGVSCRLLDIQELLSDSGVGRQQHVIVSQGNLDAILSARPEDRRAVIEEAAGVLKYRKRRERSQRRLEGTEQNLERLQDLVREVRQQLRPLQKQAEAARRHEEVAGELRQLKLHVAGRDIESLRHRQANALAEAAQYAEIEEQLRAQLAEAEPQVREAEAALASFHGDDLGDQVERLERLSQRVKGLGALMFERRRSMERALESFVSQDVVAQLESDATNVGRELEDVEVKRAELTQPLEEVITRENDVAAAWLDFEAEWGEGLPVASNEAAQIRGQLSSLQKNADALGQEHKRRLTRRDQVEAQLKSLREEAERAQQEHAEDEGRQVALAEAVAIAETRLAETQSAYEEARSVLQAGEHRASVAQARHEALTSALDASRAKAGVERLSEVEGIVGTLVDLVQIDEGFELAFEAAAGEAMAAVIVESLSSAKEALDSLNSSESSGAVLVLGQPYDESHVPEEQGIVKLRNHVKSNSKEVDDLLDRVLCCASVVDGGWRDAVDLTLRYPDLIVVTREGDRFSRSGWRLGTAGSGATVAAVEQAAADEQIATEALAALQAALADAAKVRDEAVAVERDARKALANNESHLADATRRLDRANSKAEALTAEIESVFGSIKQLDSRLAEEQQQVEQLQMRLPALEAAEASGEERARLWREARGVLEARSTEVRSERSRIEVLAKSLDERHEFLVRRRDSLSARLEQHKNEVVQAAERRERIEVNMGALSRLMKMVADRAVDIENLLSRVRSIRASEREKRKAITSELDSARRRKSEAETKLLQNGEAKQSHEVRAAELRVRLESVMETLTVELEVDAETAIDTPEPELPEGKTAKARIADLDRELRQMGPINPLALEEFNSVQERHEFLNTQLQDVQESRRELIRVIRAVDAEIQETFRAAFDDVSRHFTDLFQALFPGGTGTLRLTDAENLLETGIEIEAKPSGKNVRTLSLLSGGERSLAAMAFLFAVFRSRPSPFYLLDEVEAPLDDMNLTRFLTLIQEFRSEAQLVIVSHQKRTMEVADCLYGVTMQNGGSSKVVSQRNDIINLTEQHA